MEEEHYTNPIFEHFQWETFSEEVEELLAEEKEARKQEKFTTKDIPWDYEPNNEDLSDFANELTTKEYKDKIKAGEEVYDEDLNPDPAKYLSDDEKKIYQKCKNKYKKCSGDCDFVCEEFALSGDEDEQQAVQRMNECHVECQKKCKIVKNFCLLDQGITTINQDGIKL